MRNGGESEKKNAKKSPRHAKHPAVTPPAVPVQTRPDGNNRKQTETGRPVKTWTQSDARTRRPDKDPRGIEERGHPRNTAAGKAVNKARTRRGTKRQSMTQAHSAPPYSDSSSAPSAPKYPSYSRNRAVTLPPDQFAIMSLIVLQTTAFRATNPPAK